MEINRDTIIGDIVKENYKTAQVFDRNNIDFCCGGAISLAEACVKSKTDMDSMLRELEVMMMVNDPDSAYINGLELDELCDYIEKRHHSYVSQSIPFLQQKLQKLCDVHGEHHPELFQIRELFEGAAGNLSAHMKKEELIVFPFIQKMLKFKKGNGDAKIDSGEFSETMKTLDAEHQTEGERFEKISDLSNEYSCPPDGCNTFKITYQTLKDFEEDLHRHVHLENNVLFKKALALEQELSQ